MNKLQFFHPICHYLNGERLYYLLVKIRAKVFEVGKEIEKALRKADLALQ